MWGQKVGIPSVVKGFLWEVWTSSKAPSRELGARWKINWTLLSWEKINVEVLRIYSDTIHRESAAVTAAIGHV